MIIRGETTEDRIAKIAQGFGQGFQNFQAQQDRQRQLSLQDENRALQEEARKRQQAIQALEVANNVAATTGKYVSPEQIAPMLQSGDLQGIGAILESAPLSRKAQLEEEARKRQSEKDSLSADLTKSQIKKNEAYNPYETARIKEDARIDAETRRFNTDQQKKLKAATIPDFEVADPNIIPTAKDAEKIKTLNESNKTFQGIGNRVAEKIKNARPRDPRYYVSNEWREVQQDLTKMKLQAKNLEELGVLNGPDLALVNETLGDISPSTLALLGPEAAAKRIQTALANSEQVLRNAAESRGYKKKQTQTQSDDPLRAELEQLRQMKASRMAGG